MFHWSITEMILPLKVEWNISRNSSIEKINFLIELRCNGVKTHGEVAFNIRYGETRELIISKFEEFQAEAPAEFTAVENLILFLNQGDYPQSLKFGIESSFIHYLSQVSQKPVPQLIGTQFVSAVMTSYSIPIMPIENVGSFILKNNLNRFPFIKIKINKEIATPFVLEVLKHISVPLRIDGNECFSTATEVMAFLKTIPLEKIQFLEQPLPSHLHQESLELKKISPVELIADESVTAETITEYYAERFHGVNIKLMKSGGYLNAVKQLKEAKKLKLKTMIGCMIETSLGISSALNIVGGVDYVDLDGLLFLKNEPYHLVNEENGKIFFAYIQ